MDFERGRIEAMEGREAMDKRASVTSRIGRCLKTR